jgi:hypothetical protein
MLSTVLSFAAYSVYPYLKEMAATFMVEKDDRRNSSLYIPYFNMDMG